MSIHVPLASILVIPSLYILCRAAKRDQAKVGADGLDDWFIAWAYVAVIWAAFAIGKLST